MIKNNIFPYFIFTILSILVYSNTLDVPFNFDDEPNILFNPSVRVTEINSDSITKVISHGYRRNRPVSNLSFALNYYFNQYNVQGYHLVNIAIHAINGILLYTFLLLIHSIAQNTTTNISSSDQKTKQIALLATLLWLAHPLQIQSVTYIVQRMNCLATMFFLFSLIFYIKGRTTQKKQFFITGSVCFGLLALGSKEISATLPFYIFLIEFYFFQDLKKDWLKRNTPYFIFLILLFLGVLIVFQLGTNPIDKILNGYQKRHFTLPERLYTELRVIVFYISLLVFPHPSRLNIDHHFSISHSLLTPPTTILSLIALFALLATAFSLARKQRIISFCILWFLGNLVIESSIIGLEIIFEHRTYLPSISFFWAAMVLFNKIKLKPSINILILSTLVLVFCLWTYERNGIWQSKITLWQDAAQKSFHKPRTLSNYGSALLDENRIDEATKQFFKALTINYNFPDAHNNLGQAYKKKGNLKKSIFHYNEAMRLNPKLADPYINLGNIFSSQEDFAKARDYYQKALRLKPENKLVFYNLGAIYIKENNEKAALQYFKKSLIVDPDFAETHLAIGQLYLNQNNLQQAEFHLNKAIKRLKKKTDLALLHNDLAVISMKKQKLQNSIIHLNKALAYDPDFNTARNNLEAIMGKRSNPK